MSDLGDLAAGGKPALARALAGLETRPAAMTGLLDEAFAAPKGTVLGLTGPPGVGKSTLIDALIRAARAAGESIAVIAVDPSSRRSGGALLGDRTRFTTDPEDQGVFVRSMAARDRLGGVADVTFPAAVLMRALYDLVIIETVGVGQSETQIADMADYVAFCAQPGSGDALQFMKAGVMEIPDLVLVTKGDLGPLARRTMTDLKGALSLTSPGGTVPEVLLVSAQTGEGLEAVVSWIAGRKGGDTAQRQTQAELWATGQMRERFGLAGLEMLQRSENRLNLTQPFTSAAICTHWLTTRVFSEIRAD